jgi:uncharacterized protein YggU (UPF0235/DUF167 family)
MAEMLLQQQRACHIPLLQDSHANQHLAQQFMGLLLLGKGTVEIAAGEKFTVKQNLANVPFKELSHRIGSFFLDPGSL